MRSCFSYLNVNLDNGDTHAELRGQDFVSIVQRVTGCQFKIQLYGVAHLQPFSRDLFLLAGPVRDRKLLL